MVFYFSGTGNSAFVAEKIAKVSGDEIISINEVLKEGRWDDYSSPDFPWVFVAPVYSWRLPRIVERFIRDTKFLDQKEVYFLLTCGGESGNAVHYTRLLCEEKGWKMKGFAELVMPENYTAMFTCPEPEEANRIVAKAYQKLVPLMDCIVKGQDFPEHVAKLKFLSWITPIFYSLFVHARKFTVSEGCIHCGKCVALCPLGNISMREEDQKIIYADHCTHCMACINSCPTEAIDYGRGSKGKHRYLFSKDIDLDQVIKKD